MTWREWSGKTRTEHEALVARSLAEQCHFLSISMFGGVTDTRFAAVAITGAHPEQRMPAPASLLMLPALLATQAQDDFHPVLLSATGSVPITQVLVVFEQGAPTPTLELNLTVKEFAAANKKAVDDGTIPISIAVYGDDDAPLLAGLWAPNTAQHAWNADGVAEASSAYQARFDAQNQALCRTILTIPLGDRYTSLFRDDQIGGWSARHGMTVDEWKTELGQQKDAGFIPLSVQGTVVGSKLRYTAIFGHRSVGLPKTFRSTGSPAVPDIETAMHDLMKLGPIRHASVAIVYQGRLVHSRAFTRAEDGWPHTLPETRFRQASVSKTVTALALWRHIYQTLPAGALESDWPAHCTRILDTPLRNLVPTTDVLGGPPGHAFSSITLRHLIEHRSGVADDVQDDADIRAANLGAHFPITDAETVRYAATQPCHQPPTAKGVYNGMGYYLLQLAVAALAGTDNSFDALHQLVLAPLGMTRTRSAPMRWPLPDDEARYTARKIQVEANVTGAGLDPVQDGYGNNALHRWVGAGGLSAPPIEIARLGAIFTIAGDTSFLPRFTVDDLGARAIANAAWQNGSRPGYGFDRLSKHDDSYFGNKGGDLSTTSTGLFLDGDWAAAVAFTSRATNDNSWYHNGFGTFFDAARAARLDEGSNDLFPQYGMPRLM